MPAKMRSAMQLALKDISRYIIEKEIKVMDSYGDVWYVTSIKLLNKETRRLNKKLGINKINKSN